MSAGPGRTWPLWAALAFLLAPTAADGQSLALSHPVVIFVGQMGAGAPGPQRMTIRSTPPASASWSIPTTLPGWLAIAPAAGTGPGDVTLTVHIAGLSAGIYHVQLTVTSSPDSMNVEVFLVVMDAGGGVPTPPASVPIPPVPPPAPPGGGPPGGPTIIRGFLTPARYLVEFTFIGYSGLVDGYPNCNVNPNGIDHMIGVLSGVEPLEPGGDVAYDGSMSRFTMVDFCQVKPVAGKPDEVRWCSDTLVGGSTMRVEFEVSGQSGGGGYLKAKQEGTRSWRRVGGDCDAEVTNQIRRDYPGGSGGGGGAPDGQHIVDGLGTGQLLSAQGIARLRVGDYPADRKEGWWSMRVLARIW